MAFLTLVIVTRLEIVEGWGNQADPNVRSPGVSYPSNCNNNFSDFTNLLRRKQEHIP